MSIRPCQAGDEAAWTAFVEQSPAAHAYHQWKWAEVIAFGLGQRPCPLISFDAAGAVDGVLPLVRLTSRIFGDFIVSLPYLNYGGACAASPDVERQLVAAAVEMARAKGVQHLELRLVAPDGFGLKVKSSKMAMRLKLPADADALWKALGAKLRNQVNRPIKEGMTATFGGLDELDAFYQVFSINMRDMGTPVYSRRFFAEILRAFPDSSRICTVYHQGEPLAAGFLVGFRGTLEIPWASSLKKANRLAPNMLLYWSVLKHACESGYRVFDFGRSSPDAGTYRFKEQWGAIPVPLYWHYWLANDGAVPEINPANPKYQMAINLWKRLPVTVTRLIGPAIVRNIP
ncbi:MAG: FemAB family XrtA/PEP-CTERM system-associated protein [Vicinamibacterales bacterium]